MDRTMNFVIQLAVCLAVGLASLHASDYAKEKRWANQIVDSLMVGEAHWLSAQNHEFLSIYTESDQKHPKGAAIIMHGIGVHPNWQEVIYPLRSRLPEKGWHTLSIQLPILANEAKYSEYAPLFSELAPRINAAIEFLKGKKIKNIVIIGHSLGGTMAAYYIANQTHADVRALVIVGARLILFKNDKRDYWHSLEKLHLPVLEIYGGADTPEVVETAKKKRQIAKKVGNKHYTQIKVEGADHFFVGYEEKFINHVSAWLTKTLGN